MNKFEDMETFVRVVESGSFTAAADQMNVAKSAVSRRINELEKHLDTRLLQRTTRRLSLTETGRFYYERSVRLLDDLAELESLTQQRDADLTGTIRISGPMSFGMRYLIPLISDFMQQHEGLQIDMVLDDRKHDLVAEGFDMAVRAGTLTQTQLVAKKLGVMERVAAASPAYLERYGEPTHPDALNEGHLSLVYSLAPEHLNWRFIGNDGAVYQPRPQSRLRTNSGPALLDATIKGLGISTLPLFISEQAIREGLLKPIMPGYRLTDGAVYAVYAPGRQLSHKVRMLIDYLAKHLKVVRLADLA